MKILNSIRPRKMIKQLNTRGIILMYHRVADVEFDSFLLSVSRKNFKEQTGVIKKYCQPLQMQDMGQNLRKFSTGQKEIVVTFDDGYADNFYNAKPILEQADVPATFFITTGAINSQKEFFWHDLEKCILAPETIPETFEMTISEQNYRWLIKQEGPCRTVDYTQVQIKLPQNDTMLSRSQLYFVLNPMINCQPSDVRNEVLQKIAAWSGQSLKPRPDYFPMTTDELKGLAACKLFEIGAHTINHPTLPRLTALDQEKEIKYSKRFLEETLEKPVNSFSYPFGDYSKETLKIVKRLGFKNACTVIPRPVRRAIDPYLLPRYSVLNWNAEQFEKKLQYWLSE